VALLKGLNALREGGKEAVGVADPDHARAAMIHKLPRSCTGLSACRPVDRVTPVRRAQDRRPQGMIPLARPSADDQAEFIKNAVEQAVILRRVSAQLLIRIEDAGVLVVAVELEDVAGAVRDWLRALQASTDATMIGSTASSRRAFSIKRSKLVVMITRM
jgi:hypothetical protein